tara:strand:- start:66 stop:302 length:237 start_codon:yes stop_codon:yes gene_type:complete
MDGSNGKISCIVKTEALGDGDIASNAIETEDYLPKYENVVFDDGEMDKVVSISICDEKIHHIDGKDENKTSEPDVSEE